MAFTCPKCGWKHKASHEKYYEKRGLIKPICADCNPSFFQRSKQRYSAMVRAAFTNSYMGYAPIASVPYVPLLILLSALVAFMSPEKFAMAACFIFCLSSYVALGLITRRVGDVIGRRIIRDESISKIVVAYYSPLAIVSLLTGALWFAKVA